MKHFLLPTLIILSLSFLVNAQTPLRIVLVEEGTGTGCQWCPRGDVYGKKLLEAYPENIAYVSVHGFNSSDPMYYNDHNEILLANGLASYPSGLVNRSSIIGMDSPSAAPSDLKSFIEDQPKLNVDVETEFDENTRMLDIRMEVFAFENMSGSYRLGGIIVEDGVTGPSPLYSQSNAYAGGDNGPLEGFDNLPSPIPAEIMVYNHVSRYLLGGVNGESGSLPDQLNMDETYSYNFTYQVPETFDWEYIRVIGLVYDDSNTVVNAGLSNYLGGNSNGKPFFHSLGHVEGYTGLEYTYSIVTHDPEHEPLSITALEKPTWLELHDEGNGFGKLTGTPAAEGNFEVTLSVTDGNWEVEQNFTINVTQATSDWIQLGDPTVTLQGNVNDLIFEQDLDGVMYIATTNFDNDNAEVLKYEDGTWNLVGDLLPTSGSFGEKSIGFDENGTLLFTEGNTIYAFHNGSWVGMPGTPNVANWDVVRYHNGLLYAIGSDSDQVGFLYSFDGTDWTKYDAPISSPFTLWPQLEFTSDNEPIVMHSAGQWPANSFVSRFNGTDWEILGGGSPDPNNWVRWNNSLTVSPQGDIYAAIVAGSDRPLDVYKLEDDEWSHIGQQIATGVEDFSMDIESDDDGNIFAAFNDVTANSGATCLMYDGNEWKNVGMKGFAPQVENVKLLVNHDVPVVAYEDIISDGKIGVKKFKNLTSSNSFVQSLTGLSVYPNPASDFIYLKYNKGSTYEIFNSSGQILNRGILKGNNNDENILGIDLKTAFQGMYFIRVKDGNQIGVVSFIKH